MDGSREEKHLVTNNLSESGKVRKNKRCVGNIK